MDRVQLEFFGRISLAFADELVWCQAFECFETSCKVAGIDDVSEVLTALVVSVIMIAVNGGLFDRAVHAFDLAIRPGMFDLGEPVIDAVVGASALKGMAPEQFSFRPHLPDVDRRPAFASWIGELNAIVGENRVDGVGNNGNKTVQDCFEMAVVAF
jgi:hypothetical protein